MAGLREWSPMGDGKYCCTWFAVGSRRGGVHPQCYRFAAHLAALQRAPKRSRLRKDRAAIAAGVTRS